MDLASIEAVALSSPIDPPQLRDFAGGQRTIRKRDAVLLRIETRDGAIGYGPAGATSSAMREHFDDASQQRFARLVNQRVAPELEGTTITQPADITQPMARLKVPDSVHSEIQGAIDIALYDLWGKRQGAPIYELIGDGNVTRTLDLYASAGMYMDPMGYLDQARTLERCGFYGYKFRPGIGPAGDREIIDRLGNSLGEMAIMVDAHTWWKSPAYDYHTVETLVRSWAAETYWIEEPVSPEAYDQYLSLAETGARLAGGESEPSPDGLLNLAQTGAVRYLQGDVRHHGGYTGCLSVCAYCGEQPDIDFIPHHFGTYLGLIANAHLIAGASTRNLLEYPIFEHDPHLSPIVDSDPGMYPFPLAFDIIDTELHIDDGQLRVPDGPGLGVDVNEEVLDTYPFQPGAWTTFAYD